MPTQGLLILFASAMLSAPTPRVIKPDAQGYYEPVNNVFRNGLLMSPGIDYEIRLVPKGQWPATDIITTLQ